MRKIQSMVFLAVGIAMCLLPFVGMSVASTDITTEKRKLAEIPQITKKDGRYNTQFLQELGLYFEDHFAFRNTFVSWDSQIQAKVFGVSNVDTVLVGTDGWLYYTDSLDDYLGENEVSGRGAYNISHNIALVQKKMNDSGVQFLFTIAPNKNSLYDKNMPYYYRKKASEIKNISQVDPLLKSMDIAYVDLFEIFQDQDEILYRRQDSHWNQKGAVLAYNAMMDAIQKQHEDYSQVGISESYTEKGDLSTALYSIAAQPELDYVYDYKVHYQFLQEDSSWEDNWIETTNINGAEKVLMFRDSFGNTLSPLIAEEYEYGLFSKGSVYPLDAFMMISQPDTLIIEIVERNLDRLGKFNVSQQPSSGPPVMVGPMAMLDNSELQRAIDNTNVNICASEVQPDYLLIYGELDERYIDTETNVYVEVADEETCDVYEAFTVTNSDEQSRENKDNGYVLYLDRAFVSGDQLQVRVITETGNKRTVVEENNLTIPEILPELGH